MGISEHDPAQEANAPPDVQFRDDPGVPKRGDLVPVADALN